MQFKHNNLHFLKKEKNIVKQQNPKEIKLKIKVFVIYTYIVIFKNTNKSLTKSCQESLRFIRLKVLYIYIYIYIEYKRL